MKQASILSIFTLLILAFSGCIKYDFDEPPTDFCKDPQSISGTLITIADLVAMYDGINPIQITDDLWIAGVVTSDDNSGNIYKTMYLQDSTRGISVSLDVVNYSIQYPRGTRVWIKLQNLYVGEFGGVGLIQIGGGLDATDPQSVDRIPETLVGEHLIAGECDVAVTPLVLDIASIDVSIHQSMLIQLDDVEFVDPQGDGTFAVPGGGSGQNRMVQDCNSNQIIMRNSDFASFAGNDLPVGNGSIIGILGVFNDAQILLRDATDAADLTDTRCDGSSGSAVTILSEDFESVSVGSNITLNGWFNAAEEGSVLWSGDEFSSNRYAECSVFSAGDNTNTIWLVTPPIDMDTYTNEKINFQTLVGFPDGANLQLLVSTDFDGANNPWLYTWTGLSFTPPDLPQTGNWGPWTSSGDVDLSSYTGTIYLAFKYLGGTSIGTSTIELDNVIITGEL